MPSMLMVCTGNICRSPTADAVMRAKLAERGLDWQVDSAGISAHHAGSAPDARSQKHAAKRGYDLSSIRARLLVLEDFERFDLLLAMDKSHLSHMEAMRPYAAKAELALFLPHGGIVQPNEVPDPYYEGHEAFEHVLDLVERATEGIINRYIA